MEEKNRMTYRQLEQYAKSLELQVRNLERDLKAKGNTNMKLAELAQTRSREIKRLKAHIEWLHGRLKELDPSFKPSSLYGG